MANTVYFDQAGKPRLLGSYCVFADFLGFKHLILEAIKQGKEVEVFRRFVDEIEPEIERIINPDPKHESEEFPRSWDAKVFTDNVVLGYALRSDRGEQEFGHAITQLVEFQYAVALKGFFVRGGWAVGNLFMNRNTVFGGSLLDAYELESTKAMFPRIILSDGMKDLVYWHMARYAEEPPQCNDLLVDAEGGLFTNYLSESIVDGDVQWDELHSHAQVICDRLNEYSNNGRVLPKYQWLAAYHNFFCGLVSKGDGYSDSVRVTGTFPTYGLRELTHDESPYVVEAKAESKKRNERLAALRAKNKG